MKKVAFERGITLVALVITIIVLLILAGVTLNMILGEDGLIEKAKKSAIVTELKELQEKVDIAIAAETVKAQKENRKFAISEYETLNSLGIESKYSEIVGVTAGKIYMKNVATEEMIVAAQSIGTKIGRLPEEYQEVEYIESTGTQYIDTEVSGNNDNLKFEVQYSWTTVPASGVYRYVFGTYNNESYNTTRLLQYGSGITYTNINVKAGGSTTVFNSTRTANTIYTESLDSTEYISNDTVTPEIGLSKGTINGQTVKLFNLTSSNSSALIKLYYFRIYDNNVLVRNMIPCYNVQTNEIGMYDTVNKKFYTSPEGTGEFIKGNDV